MRSRAGSVLADADLEWPTLYDGRVRPGSLFANRFEIERQAGAGGMATIYRATDRQSGRPVALKVMQQNGVDRERATRFLHEAEVLAEVRHPGIVQPLTHGTTDDGSCFLAMEWLEGEDLSTRLRAGPLDLAAVLRLGLRAAEALGAAHAAGIVHRDVKPANLFLVEGDVDRVKLIDFGVASRAGEVPRGPLLGTPSYMAPEQVRGVKLDPRCDVFALGGVLFTALTGRLPFPGEDEIAVCVKILLDEAPPVRELRAEVPLAIEQLLARLLAKEPSDRPWDGSIVAEQLAAVLRGELGVAEVPAARALTAGEQRVLSILLVRPSDLDDAPTRVIPADLPEPTDGLSTAGLVKRHGGELERLPDGSFVVTLVDAPGAATDQAAQAARLALALRDFIPGSAIALATGRGVLTGSRLVGEVVDRAARMLRTLAPGEEQPVAIDEVSAGLLDAQLDVRGGDGGVLLLHGIGDAPEVVRLLLGKPTPCLGRDVELAELSFFLERCIEERAARGVLVTAPPGLGKSRLRHELLRRARAYGVEVMMGRAEAMSAGAPLALITSSLRLTCGLKEDEPLALQQQRLRARVGRHLSGDTAQRVAEFLGELLGVPFSDEGSVQLRSARLDPVLMADQRLNAWQTFLAAECDARPVVLVLEDLHWGDLATVKFIDAALRNLADKPLFVLALARPEVHGRFPVLWEDRAVAVLPLAHLSPEASAHLVREVLPDAAPHVVERLCELAAGNAFYLEELIRAAQSGEVSTFPETVLAMVHGRLEGLSAEQRRVLRAASVFGETFWSGGVAALCGEGREEIHQTLQALVSAELVQPRIERRFAAEDEYIFRHALVREAAYAALTDKDRALGHRLAGAWLAEAGERTGATLAEHFERGGDQAQALQWYHRAAQQALRANDLDAAVARAERALQCGAEGRTLGELRLLLAEAHSWLGRLVQGERWGLEAMAVLPRGSVSWWNAASEVAFCAGNLANYEGLETLVNTMREAGAQGDGEGAAARARVVASARAVAVLFPGGRYQLACSLFDDFNPLADAIMAEDPAVAGAVHWARGWHATYRKDLAQALFHRRAAAASFAEAGDRRSQTHQLSMVGSVYNKVGCYREAVAVLKPARDTAQELGITNVLAQVDNNLGYALCALGELEEGLAIEQEAVTLFSAAGNRRLEAGSRGYRARFMLDAGRVDEAEAEIRAAIRLASTTPPALAYHGAMLARVHLAAGRASEALAAAREAHALLESLGGLDEGESLVRLALAQGLAACGQQAEATAAIVEARARLMARAAPITDPVLRTAFLESVSDNMETLALASAWTP